jgi:hypothetical protein
MLQVLRHPRDRANWPPEVERIESARRIDVEVGDAAPDVPRRDECSNGLPLDFPARTIRPPASIEPNHLARRPSEDDRRSRTPRAENPNGDR